jgi:hypothetical protein
MGAVLRAYMQEPTLARFSLKPASKLGVVFPSRLPGGAVPAPSQAATLHPMRNPDEGSSH